jgi:dyslexia susceptibility 1 candidate gene 1 protein
LPRQKGKQGQKQEGTELEQKNPIWVKGKADEFFKNKDFYSAINGYTQAHKLDSNMISNLFNRAACHLHLFNFEETLADCSKI